MKKRAISFALCLMMVVTMLGNGIPVYAANELEQPIVAKEETINEVIEDDTPLSTPSEAEPSAGPEGTDENQDASEVEDLKQPDITTEATPNEAIEDDLRIGTPSEADVNETPDSTIVLPDDLLSLESPRETAYYGEDMVTSDIIINGAHLLDPLESAYLEVRFPTSLYSGKELVTDNFIDHVSLSPLSGTGTKPIVTTENGVTSIKMGLTNLDNTTLLTVPYNFSFKDRLTPDGYAVTPRIILYDKDDNILTQTDDKTYTLKYDTRQASKSILGIDGKGYVYAGQAKESDANRISETKADVVPFIFGLGTSGNIKHYRQLETVVITDTLPTYVNSKGQTVAAKFDPALNPEWTDNGDGTVSTTVHFSDPNHGDLRNDINQDLSKLRLNLLFPDALITENGQPVAYTNHVSLQEKPYNQADTEEDIVHDASKDFYLKMETLDGRGLLKKVLRSGNIQYDKNSLYAERPTYRFIFTNQYSSPLTEITITEDAQTFDSRFFLSEFVYLHITNPQEALFEGHAKIRAYRKDGSYVDIPMKPNLKVNETAEQELSKMADNVNNGIIKADDTQAVEPEFIKFTFIFEDGFSLQPGASLGGDIRMAFKDPYHVEYSDKRDIKNEISVDCKYTTIYGEKIPLHVTASDSTQFVPVYETISLSKGTEGQKTGTVGERINFRISLNTARLSKNRYLRNPTFIDLLPKGLSVTKDTIVKTFYQSENYLEDWEVIENYQNTGRTAIKVNFQSGRVNELRGGDINGQYSLNFFISNLEINENIIPTLAETNALNNNNDIYFFTDDNTAYPDEISSDNLVIDTLDVNQNGETTDKILRSSSKVLGTISGKIYSSKSIRSLESVKDVPELNDSAEWTGSIKTNYSGTSNTDGKFQYQIQVHNYTSQFKNALVLYDVLPYKGDGRGSMFSNEFLGNVTLSAGNQDMTDQFDIYYRTDQYPSNNAKKEIKKAGWTKTPASWKDVTAIKAVMKSDAQLPPYSVLSMVWDMKAPDYDAVGDLGNQSAFNTFYVSYTAGNSFEQGNTVENTLPMKWKPMVPAVRTVSVQKIWVGEPAQEVRVTLLANGKKLKDATLNESNHWFYDFKDLPVMEQMTDQGEIQYTIEEEAVDGYTTSITGNMNDGFVITNSFRDYSVDKNVTESSFRREGDILHYTLTITNTGKTDFETLNVKDTLVPFDKMKRVESKSEDGRLEVGEIWTLTYDYEVTAADVEAGKVWNKVSVTNPERPNDTPKEDTTETRKEDVYKVLHEFVSGTPGKELPHEVADLTPGNQENKTDGTEVRPTPSEKTEVKTRDGVWRFLKWDKTSDVIANHDVTFVGMWVFETKPGTDPDPGNEPGKESTGNLTVTKTVSGSGGDQNKDFTFTVTLDKQDLNGQYGDMTFTNGVTTFTLKHGQSKTANGLPTGVAYTVEESDNSGYTVTKTNAAGTIRTGSTATAAIENYKGSSGGSGGSSSGGSSSHTPQAARVTLTATKTMDGLIPTGSGFTFFLDDANGQRLQVKNNQGDNITFDTMTFNKTGTYVYYLTEQTGNDKNINYDTASYKVTVTVTCPYDYAASVSYEKNGQAYNSVPAFANTTKQAAPAPAQTSPVITPARPLDKIPKTEDSSNLALWGILAAASLLSLTVLLAGTKTRKVRSQGKEYQS